MMWYTHTVRGSQLMMAATHGEDSRSALRGTIPIAITLPQQ